MQYFEYKTRNHADGKIFKGIITADNIETAESTLKKRGEDIIVLSEMQDILNIRKTLYSLSVRTNKKTKLEFFTMLRFMLEAGMSLHESLVNIRDTGVNKSLKGLAGKIADSVRRGSTLSVAANGSGQFDHETVEQLKAGEESGSILNTLSRLMTQYEREIEFKSKIKTDSQESVFCFLLFLQLDFVLVTTEPIHCYTKSFCKHMQFGITNMTLVFLYS